MRSRWALAPLIAAALLSGCGAPRHQVSVGDQGPLGNAGTELGAVHSRAAAHALAVSLLGRAVLPPGSAGVSAAPAAALRQPPEQPGTTDLATATRFATTDRSMAVVDAFFEAHPPAGHRSGGASSGSAGRYGTTTDEYVGYPIGHLPAGVAGAQLLLTVAPRRGGGSGIRVDAQVTWYPRKPAAADVPRGDRVAVVALVETLPVAEQRQDHVPAPRRVVVTDPTTVGKLRIAADGLQAATPGARSCPADLGTRYVVAFGPATGAAPNRTYTAGSCGEVAVAGASGKTIATLSDDQAFDAAYRQVLGLNSGAP